MFLLPGEIYLRNCPSWEVGVEPDFCDLDRSTGCKLVFGVKGESEGWNLSKWND